MYIDVRVNGANYPCGLVYMNNANTHIPFVGAVEVDNIPRGTYTFVLQWSRGFNTVTLDANDAWSVTLTETNRSPDL